MTPNTKHRPGDVLIRRRNRRTGTTVHLARDTRMLDSTRWSYVTRCEDHDCCELWGDRRHATSWLSDPTAWCRGCQNSIGTEVES